MSTPAKASKTLTLAVLIALALLLAINTITKERIAKTQQDFLLSNLSARGNHCRTHCATQRNPRTGR